MYLSARRLRHELDRVLAVCGADDLLHPDSRGAGQVLVNTSALLMVLQGDISQVLDARQEASECLLSEAKTVVTALRAQTGGREKKRRPAPPAGADKPHRAG